MSTNKKLAVEWLKSALLDIRNIEKIIDDEFLTPVLAFHAQQAIKKSFKSLMEYNKVTIPKTHNLEKLYKKIEGYIDIDFDRLEVINELYIDSRYPGDFGLLPYGKPTLEDAKEFYGFAEDVFERVCEVLEIDKRDYI